MAPGSLWHLLEQQPGDPFKNFDLSDTVCASWAVCRFGEAELRLALIYHTGTARVADAIDTLQQMEQKGFLAPRSSYHLYQLCLKSGDATDAKMIRAELLHRLPFADPDFPVLVELKKAVSEPTGQVSPLRLK